ncbi:MAG: nitrite/sulfite reductase, partial [Gammaproteobacteria bacterium]|nr:nitrite/sulfite reductase [Gammaproteobacteria bacterium]
HIGILGVDKHGEEWYQLTLGGSPGGDDAALGDRLGAAVAKHRVADTVARLFGVYRRERLPGESFLQTYRRIGLSPFKESAYAADPQS